ncbi:MAG: polysaccharide deacetylase family protein, partial [Proteobacteria bacterium]|nr:polysaccharide deacetylase family protein [Pseudomonadota bacterium]
FEPAEGAEAVTRPVVCLTHDLDRAACWEFLPRLIEMETALGFTSTINVLAAGPYRLDPGYLRGLAETGFEIGLHGLTHDVALGFRSPARIRETLARAQEAVGLVVKGFRAPALAVSEALLTELCRAGFIYDSSVAAWRGPWGAAAGPYRYPGIDIIEVPLTLADDLLWRDLGLDEASAREFFWQTLDRVTAVGGTFVLNVHPCLAAGRLGFWEGILAGLAERGAMVVPVKTLLRSNHDPADEETR